MAVTVEAKPYSQTSLGGMKRCSSLLLGFCSSDGPARKPPCACSLLHRETSILCEDSVHFRRTCLQDKESCFFCEIADGGLLVLIFLFEGWKDRLYCRFWGDLLGLGLIVKDGEGGYCELAHASQVFCLTNSSYYNSIWEVGVYSACHQAHMEGNDPRRETPPKGLKHKHTMG